MKATHILICALCAASAITAAAAWKTERKIDEMTDAVSYFIETYANPVGEKPFEYRPVLLIRVKPSRIERTTKKLDGDIGALIGLGAMDTISFTAKDVTLRFDSNPAQKWNIVRAKSPGAFFIADAERFLECLSSATTLKARVDVVNTLLTLTFRVADFKDEIEVVKNAILKTRPAGIQIYDAPATTAKPAPPAPAAEAPSDNPAPALSASTPPRPKEVRCRKCRGSGRVEVWQPCASCNGSTRGCDRCRNSGWIGRQKSTTECPRCKGYGVTPAK